MMNEKCIRNTYSHAESHVSVNYILFSTFLVILSPLAIIA
jgi:hypothetical protein